MASDWNGNRVDFDILDALKIIERNDPDGGSHQPTEADYANHQRWAIETFGMEVWKKYSQSGWDVAPEE